MPRSHGYGDVTATYIRRSKIPSRIYAKHQYKQELEYGSTWCIIHFNIWVQLQSYHRKWPNITIILHHQYGANVRIQGVVQVWTVRKVAQSHSRRTLELNKGGLEGWGSGRSAGDPRYRCATLISNRENPHAPSSKTWTWGSRGVRTPRRVVMRKPDGEYR